VFRDKHKNQEASTELRLPLTDFVSEEIASSLASVQDHIVISSATLCEYLTEAEGHQQIDDLDNLQGPQRKKWVGSPSPSLEELTPKDEKKFEKGKRKTQIGPTN
jgi:hypothetical protein